MGLVSEAAVLQSLRAENPWWTEGGVPAEARLPRRAFYPAFHRLVVSRKLRRTAVVLGPRRVGKTVMALQVLADWISAGHDPARTLYVSLDSPAYARASLQELLDLYSKAVLPNGTPWPELVVFDEIQFLPNWETELKVLTDRHPNVRFVATGSAASALAKAARESGAGRFTDFLLPPLLFNEFLTLTGSDGIISRNGSAPPARFASPDEVTVESIAELNAHFERYVNFGGFPEVARSDLRGAELSRFVKSDILDKSLLRDLPQLYGVTDTRELYHLFSVLSFRTGNEFTLEGLSQSARIAKTTIKKYIEYLESSFLVARLERIDQNARRFMRAPSFKVHLLNPALRAALFSPIASDDEMFGHVVESAIYANLWPLPDMAGAHYARWDGGEIDLVGLDSATQSPVWACEVKWSDRHWDRPEEVAAILDFAGRKPSVENIVLTTRSRSGIRSVRGVVAPYMPAAALCWLLGVKVAESDFETQGLLFPNPS